MNLLVNSSGMKMGEASSPPLGLMYIAACEPDTEIIDLTVYPDINFPLWMKKHRPKVVGVTMYTPNRHEALRILKIAKRHGAITVAGGPHTSLLTKMLVENYSGFVDHFVLGDGEIAWKKICDGEDMPQVIKERVEDLDSLPLPAWDRIDWKHYQDYLCGSKCPRRTPKWFTHYRGHDLAKEYPFPLVLGRGCDGMCTFCSTWWVNGKFRSHGVEWIKAHLDKLWNLGIRRIQFDDDCLGADRQSAMDLCDVLENYDFVFWATSRVDCIDYELAKRLHDVGCYGISFGVETSVEEILWNMKKDINPADAMKARKACRDAGLKFTALMMRGFPGMTDETRALDNQFLRELDPDDIGTIGETWVLPGTTLYTKCKRRGLLDDSFWLGPEPYFICPVDLQWEK